ncbi:MAG: cyclopropane fatty acyl phospholipid synthase [Desulfomonile tiedjei]|nr:cyclopropane fatty acyl phospholipid synthase [Desulfomonile tiedjei]
MGRHKQIVKDLFSLCDITIDGANPWDLQVTDDRFYARVLADKSLGLGESYMDGWWQCARVDEFICRILQARVDRQVNGSWKLLLPALLAVVSNRQSLMRSRQVAERHYDLGNDLFFSFLDPYNQYSCACFNGTDDLDHAQVNKMELICRKLNLKGGDHVLDIGSGWGGLALYMTEKFACTVTAINISDEQIAFAREFCKSLPVEILQADYRRVEGTFDEVVSVGMFEHVGRKNYRVFMETVHRCLKDGGVFLLHTIGNNRSQYESDPWVSRYIFPNGELPSVAQISRAVEGLFVVEDLHNLGPHYDRTLMAWNERFQSAWPSLSARYDERFKRMWEYYLLSCAGAFRARDIQLWQIVFTKCGTRQPACRY